MHIGSWSPSFYGQPGALGQPSWAWGQGALVAEPLCRHTTTAHISIEVLRRIDLPYVAMLNVATTLIMGLAAAVHPVNRYVRALGSASVVESVVCQAASAGYFRSQRSEGMGATTLGQGPAADAVGPAPASTFTS